MYSMKKKPKPKGQHKEQQINTQAELFFIYNICQNTEVFALFVQAGGYDCADTHKAGQYSKN